MQLSAIFLFFGALIWAASAEPPLSIIHGNPASLGQFPWQAALYVTKDSQVYFCGGSIIGEDWILTAAHCVQGAVWGTVVTGFVNMSSIDGTVHGVDKFIVHEDFDNVTKAGNIALVKLSQPVVFVDNARAVELANETLGSGVDVTVTGWGVIDEAVEYASEMLNYVVLTSVANSECQSNYGNFNISDDMICGASSEDSLKSPCTGDFGGPVVINPESAPVQVAITSFTSPGGCSEGPSGYTRVAVYRDWIKDKCGV